MDDDTIILSLLDDGPAFFNQHISKEENGINELLLKYQIKFVTDDEIFENGAEEYLKELLNNHQMYLQLINLDNGMDFNTFFKNISYSITRFGFNDQIKIMNIMQKDKRFLSIFDLNFRSFIKDILKNVKLENSLLFVNTFLREPNYEIFLEYSINIFNKNIQKKNLSSKPEDNKNLHSDKYLAVLFYILTIIWNKIDHAYDMDETYVLETNCPIKWLNSKNNAREHTFENKLFFSILFGLNIVFIPVQYRSKKWESVLSSIGTEISHIITFTPENNIFSKMFLEKLYEELSYVESVIEMDKKICSNSDLCNNIHSFYKDFLTWFSTLEECHGIHDYLADINSYIRNSDFESEDYSIFIGFLMSFIKEDSKIQNVNTRYQTVQAFCKISALRSDEYDFIKNNKIIPCLLKLSTDICKSDQMVHDKLIMNNTIQKLMLFSSKDISNLQIDNIMKDALSHDHQITESYIMNSISLFSEIYDIIKLLREEDASDDEHTNKMEDLCGIFSILQPNISTLCNIVLVNLEIDNLSTIVLSKHVLSSICLFLNTCLELFDSFLKKSVDGKLIFKSSKARELESIMTFTHKHTLKRVIDTILKLIEHDGTLQYLAHENYNMKIYHKISKKINGDRSDKLISIVDLINNLKGEEYQNEAPDEFLDPLTYNIIEDPICLPDMENVEGNMTFIDRANIMKCIIEKGENPFTREKLSVDRLKEYNDRPDIKAKTEDLLKRINLWKQKNKKE